MLLKLNSYRIFERFVYGYISSKGKGGLTSGATGAEELRSSEELFSAPRVIYSRWRLVTHRLFDDVIDFLSVEVVGIIR